MNLYIKFSVCVPRLIPGRGFYAQMSLEITSEFLGMTHVDLNQARRSTNVEHPVSILSCVWVKWNKLCVSEICRAQSCVWVKWGRGDLFIGSKYDGYIYGNCPKCHPNVIGMKSEAYTWMSSAKPKNHPPGQIGKLRNSWRQIGKWQQISSWMIFMSNSWRSNLRNLLCHSCRRGRAYRLVFVLKILL